MSVSKYSHLAYSGGMHSSHIAHTVQKEEVSKLLCTFYAIIKNFYCVSQKFLHMIFIQNIRQHATKRPPRNITIYLFYLYLALFMDSLSLLFGCFVSTLGTRFLILAEFNEAL